ncbi:universal stress protein [Microbacterium sp. SLBN-146]|uniref:universal stress protein n=1 Tax=Microbacterium sp. SLBN-146 TaxID=2768457 RepID=UPI001150F8C7|nr:universal stress protein [Microbacterium sp. SLBN-146]TQJ31321.1 nucleotide-binding universal stress UspA family protein [Microbacterium sp. SLBN-146]
MEEALPTPRSIIVGIDGSEPSRAALRYAAEIGPKLGLPVEAVVVWDYPTLAWGDAYYYPESAESLRSNAERLLAVEVERAFPAGTPAWLRTGIRQGGAAHELIDASRDAAMLVVGTRGHGGFTGLLLGSVSSSCVSHAHCPVLVVRGEASISAEETS